MFFRSEGGSSSTFGEVQAESSNRLSYVEHTHTLLPNEPPYSYGVPIPAAGWSDFVLAGYFNSESRNYEEGIHFLNSGDETRPVNMAVRIWERI